MPGLQVAQRHGARKAVLLLRGRLQLPRCRGVLGVEGGGLCIVRRGRKRRGTSFPASTLLLLLGMGKDRGWQLLLQTWLLLLLLLSPLSKGRRCGSRTLCSL